jgi:hypothetical protein
LFVHVPLGQLVLSPGVHAAVTPVHVPRLYSLQVHVIAEHVRVRVSVPVLQGPHGCESICMSPPLHSVDAPAHSLGAPYSPQVQVSGEQVRVRDLMPVLQLPQASISLCCSPGWHCLFGLSQGPLPASTAGSPASGAPVPAFGWGLEAASTAAAASGGLEASGFAASAAAASRMRSGGVLAGAEASSSRSLVGSIAV